MRKFRAFSLTLTLVFVSFVSSQYFDPNLDDKTYLDQIENDVNGEVEDAKQELIGQAKLIEDVTKVFIEAKLRENLFMALRSMAENEGQLQAVMSEKQKTKQQKQLSKQEEDGDEDGETTVSTTSGNGTSSGPSGLVPKVANIIKTLFGGSNRVNLTSYVEAVTKYLPDAVGNQVLGVAKLLGQSPASAARRSTTLIPTTIIYPPTEKEKPDTNSTTLSPNIKVSVGTSIKPGNKTEEEEDGEEEEEDNGRQLRLPDLSGGLSILGALLGGTPESRTTTGKPGVRQRKTTTESASGFEEETTSTSGNLANFANDVRNGVGDLIKVVPDLFKGAREGVSLLSALRELFGSFGGGGR